MDATISLEELQRYIEEKKDYVLIDVRNEDELAHGMIPTAKHLPLPELQEAFHLDADDFKERYGFEKMKLEDDIIFYCRTGARSHMAMQMIQALGYHARNYQGSIWEWSQIDPEVHRYGPSPE